MVDNSDKDAVNKVDEDVEEETATDKLHLISPSLDGSQVPMASDKPEEQGSSKPELKRQNATLNLLPS